MTEAINEDESPRPEINEQSIAQEEQPIAEVDGDA